VFIRPDNPDTPAAEGQVRITLPDGTAVGTWNNYTQFQTGDTLYVGMTAATRGNSAQVSWRHPWNGSCSDSQGILATVYDACQTTGAVACGTPLF
jgi:hypothetical protein